MPQLDPTWFASQLFWLLVTFVTFYFVMAKFVLPAVQDVLARRAQTLSSDIEQAQSLKSQAEQAKQDYEKALAESRAKAQQFTTDAQLAHKAKSEQSARDMDKVVAQKLAEASTKIDSRKQELMTSLTPTATELAGLIVQKLTKTAPANDKVQAVVNTLSKARNG